MSSISEIASATSRTSRAKDRLQGSHAADRRSRVLRGDDPAARRLARPREPALILGAEARGFIFGAALAYALGAGFIAARKPGKLPRETVEATYEPEYGTDSLQVHKDAVPAGTRVIVLDDVLATGTARAKVELVEGLGGIVAGVLFVIELDFLHGRERLAGYDVHSLVTY